MTKLRGSSRGPENNVPDETVPLEVRNSLSSYMFQRQPSTHISATGHPEMAAKSTSTLYM